MPLTNQNAIRVDQVSVQVAPPTPLVLDNYSATIAYSTRKLRNAYTGYCMRVRRLSDNATLDVGFVNNYVDLASMSAFGASTGNRLYVTIWYDQSGNGNDAIQVVAGQQPQIFDSGVFTTTSDGKLAMYNPAPSDDFHFRLTTAINSMASGFTCYNVCQRTLSNQWGWTLGTFGANNVYTGVQHFGGSYFVRNTQQVFSVADGTTTQNLWTTRVPNTGITNAFIHKNGVNQTIGNTPLGVIAVSLNSLGASNSGNANGYINEYILFMSQQLDADVTAIETNILAYY